MKQELRDFVIDNFLFGRDSVNLADGDSLIDKGVIDSTGVMELVAFLQQRYGIEVHDGDLTTENLDSIDSLEKFVARRVGTAKGQIACR